MSNFYDSNNIKGENRKAIVFSKTLLQIIDDAIKTTQRENYKNNNIEYITNNVLCNYLFNNSISGFSNNPKVIEELSLINNYKVNKEILKNIVKVFALQDYENDKTEKRISSNLDPSQKHNLPESEYICYLMLEKYPESIMQIFNKYPNLYKEIVESFVYRRYFKSNSEVYVQNLDNPIIIKGKYKELMDKIDMIFNNQNQVIQNNQMHH